MGDESKNDVPVADTLDLDRLYANYLRTCAMSGITPVSRERADGLIQEWTEMPSGRPEPTAH